MFQSVKKILDAHTHTHTHTPYESAKLLLNREKQNPTISKETELAISYSQQTTSTRRESNKNEKLFK